VDVAGGSCRIPLEQSRSQKAPRKRQQIHQRGGVKKCFGLTVKKSLSNRPRGTLTTELIPGEGNVKQQKGESVVQNSGNGGPISQFISHHYRHFNAAALVDAAQGYRQHLDSGGRMMVCLAGAMSTAELGLSLAQMIREDKVHMISCTGANLEEDVFNLVAHDFYERAPHYRQLSPADEQDLLNRHMNRVTDTCIPEGEAMRRMEAAMLEVWTEADRSGQRFFPHEFFYKVLLSGKYREHYQIDPKDSWMLAAAEKICRSLCQDGKTRLLATCTQRR